jgi:outer membrane protein OmpA-like peptidoglycan-associated protein
VGDQITQLRADMESGHADLATRIDEATQSADEAMARAEAAYGSAEGTRQLALGKVGYREAEHDRIYFAFNSAELSPEAEATLASVAAQIENNPQYLVDLYGFADPTGPPEYNLTLGKLRADAALRYLAANAKGQLSRYQTISFGEGIPERELQGMSTKDEQRQVLISLVERVEVESQDTLSQNHEEN